MKTSAPERVFERGLQSLSEGKTLEALAQFEASLRLEERTPNPARRARYASYYGYCVAAAAGRVREGLTICRQAAASEFFTPDILLNLARVQLLAGDRKSAWETLMSGIRLDPDHAGLRSEARKMGIRRRPVISMLDRSHPLNRVAGRLAAASAPQAKSRAKKK
jgi:hypothetical protein